MKEMASGNDHWNTPPELADPALMVLRRITLDPFSNETSIVQADRRVYEGDDPDGFKLLWRGERVFVNGPWSRTRDVVQKCVDEWMSKCEIVAVIPTSLNSSYWHHIDEAPATCRPRRRVSFMRDGVQVKGNRQDCVVVYWGPDIYRFRAHFRELGHVRFG